MQASLRLLEQEIYSGEYPCIPTYHNGSRRLVTFAVALRNSGNESVHFSPYDTPVRVNWWLESPVNTLLSSGYFNLSCVRDTTCDGGESALQFFVCQTGGLSSNCSTYLNTRTPCQWVDITGLNPWLTYWLRLSLRPSIDGLGNGTLDQGNVTLTFNPSQLKKTNIADTTATLLLMMAILVPNLTYFIVLLIITARHGKDIVNYKTYRLHSE